MGGGYLYLILYVDISVTTNSMSIDHEEKITDNYTLIKVYCTYEIDELMTAVFTFYNSWPTSLV